MHHQHIRGNPIDSYWPGVPATTALGQFHHPHLGFSHSNGRYRTVHHSLANWSSIFAAPQAAQLPGLRSHARSAKFKLEHKLAKRQAEAVTDELFFPDVLWRYSIQVLRALILQVSADMSPGRCVWKICWNECPRALG